MTSLDTELYATQRNGGKAGVTIQDIGNLVGGGTVPAASTTVAGIVKQSATQAALTSVGPGTPASGLVDVTVTPTQATINANFATLGTVVDSILTKLKAAGIMA